MPTSLLVFIHALKTVWIRRYGHKISCPLIPKAKAQMVVDELEKWSVHFKQPISLFLWTYAYYTVFMLKQQGFGSIYLRLGDFKRRMIIQGNFPEFTDDDVELAFQVDKVWNSMNRLKSSDLPFGRNEFMAKAGIVPGVNTRFKLAHNFLDFCRVARFVNRHRMVFPALSGLHEFFIHLPTVYKAPRDYYIREYYNPYETLDRYYRMVFPKICGAHRVEAYAKTQPVTYDMFDYFRKSKLWGGKEIAKWIKMEILRNEQQQETTI